MVHIVSQGETSEGSRILGVFGDIEKARTFAAARREEITGDITYRPVVWEELAPDYWEDVDGCDFVKIQSLEVL